MGGEGGGRGEPDLLRRSIYLRDIVVIECMHGHPLQLKAATSGWLIIYSRSTVKSLSVHSKAWTTESRSEIIQKQAYIL